MADFFNATGRRKESVARVRVLVPGHGKQTVNGRPLDAYFGRRNLIIQVRLGIARALLGKDDELKKTLRSTGCLTRDPRMKERKKYGQPGARKRFQFSKR